jgi:hypothetical protein
MKMDNGICPSIPAILIDLSLGLGNARDVDMAPELMQNALRGFASIPWNTV